MPSPRMFKQSIVIGSFILVLAFLTACGTPADLPDGEACWEQVGGDLSAIYCSTTDDSTRGASSNGDSGTTTETVCLDFGPDGCSTGYSYFCISGFATWSKLNECRTALDIPAPALWAAFVCEPNDGFSDDGWLTLDSDADLLPYGSILYVAASPDGPWYPTEFLQPPYVMSQLHVSGMTAWMGLSDYHDLWFRPSQAGSPARLGSMITDREGHLPELCGTE